MLRAAALLVTTVFICDAFDENSLEGADSEILAESLRQQLMKNNYDYTSSETKESQSDEITLKQKNLSGKDHNTEKKRADYSKHSFKNDIKSNLKPVISASLENMSDESNLENSNTHHISNDPKLKVQGMNSKEIHKRNKTLEDKNWDSIKPRQIDRISYEEGTSSDQHHTPIVKYKILKVKDNYRRSGKQAVLIQEESPDGVAIVNLGHGPLLPFKLPHTRRQYMHDTLDIEAFGDDEELPPPSVNETTSEEEIQETNSEIPKTTRAEKHSSDKVQSTLSGTMIHDEIFIL